MVEIYCDECDKTVEPNLYPVGLSDIEVKVNCPKCGRCLKHYNINNLPHIAILRATIWEIAQHNTRVIDSCKILCKFTPNYIGYWNLYLKVKQICKSVM